MCNSSYNGWKNYETWAANLWLENDEGSYHMCVEMANEAGDEGELARMLEQFVDEFAPQLPPGLHSDLLIASLQAIDWYEIAANMFEAYREEEEEEEEEE